MNTATVGETQHFELPVFCYSNLSSFGHQRLSVLLWMLEPNVVGNQRVLLTFCYFLIHLLLDNFFEFYFRVVLFFLTFQFVLKS